MSSIVEDVSFRTELQANTSKGSLKCGEALSPYPLSSSPFASLSPMLEPQVALMSSAQPLPMQTVETVIPSVPSFAPPVYEVMPNTPMLTSYAAPAAALPVGYAQCQTIVHPPVTVPSSLVSDIYPPIAVSSTLVAEKQQDSLTMQEVQEMLRQERTKIFTVMQETIVQQMKQCMESCQSRSYQVCKAMAADVNSTAAACEDRIVRLEVDRAARANALQKLKGQMDAQIEKVDQVLVQLSNDNRKVLEKIVVHKEEVLLSQQALQRKLETSVLELSSAHVKQVLQAYANDIETGIGGLTDRVSALELRLQDVCRSLIELDVVELRQSVNFEKQAREGLSESLNAYRVAYLQTFKDFRMELDALREKPRCDSIESSEVRSRLSAVERLMSDLRSSAAKACPSSCLKDVHDLSRQVSDLSQSLDSYRNAHLQASTELSNRCDRISDKLMLMEPSYLIGRQL